MAHAYVVAGDLESGIQTSQTFAVSQYTNPDTVILRHSLFSVEDARKLSDIAHAAPIGEHKIVI
ncbi:MAG TPA: hypothetical protein VJA87_02175, partial [Candidatus Paceibacterota bacterium]